MAVLHIARERSRSAYTLGLVMVVLSILFAVATTNLSLHRSLDDLLRRRFGADLLVYFQGAPPSAADAIRGDAEVRSLVAVTLDQVEVLEPVSLGSRGVMVVDADALFDAVGFVWTSGDDRMAETGLSSGGATLLPSTMAVELGVAAGDTIRVRSHGHERTLEVAAIYAAFGTGPELGLVVGAPDREPLGIDTDHDIYYIHTSDADEDRSVEQRVREELTRHDLTPFVNTGTQVREEARQDIAAWFRLFFTIVLVAAVVGMLALANTMAATIVQRSREIGALRALGASDPDIHRMVVVEAGTLASIAFVLSLGLGLLLALLIVGAFRQASGVDVTFVYAWTWIPILGVLALVITMVSSIAPARRAARITPVEALRTE